MLKCFYPLFMPELSIAQLVGIFSFVRLRAASNWSLRATWAKTAAPTWHAASLRYGSNAASHVEAAVLAPMARSGRLAAALR